MQTLLYGKNSALRCLALGFKRWGADRLDVRPEDEAGLTLVGMVGMQDPPRPEVRDAIDECRCVAASLRFARSAWSNPAALVCYAGGASACVTACVCCHVGPRASA